MRKIVSGIVLIASTLLMAQDTFNLHSVVSPTLGDSTLWPASSGPRGVWSGTDLDKDGRQEVWAVDYNGNSTIHAFEWYYGDTLVHVWSSQPTNTTYSTGTRTVRTGDLDGDGLGEVIFFAGRYTYSDSLQGLYVYEWDGQTDNGYGAAPAWHRNMHTVFEDTLYRFRVENFEIADMDGDGKQEMLWAQDDYPSNPTYGTTSTTHSAYSGDRFTIASVNGDIGSTITPPVLVEEMSMSPRDADKDGVRENKYGGGSPYGVAIADTDGDGTKEAFCFSWNNLSVFVMEATGPDAYAASDTGYKMVTLRDDWTLGATTADMNKDGKDEVYVGAFYVGIVYGIVDLDGDATTFMSSEYGVIDSVATEWATNGKSNVYLGGVAASNNAFGEPTLIVPHTPGFSKLDFSGSTVADIFDQSKWTRTQYDDPPTQLGGINKLYAGANLDRDKYGELVMAYQGVSDSLYTGTDSVKANDHRDFIRILEWTGESTDLSVKDIVLITPEDFKLKPNYPNPFNPSTTIEYTLPIASKISISIYNVIGQEVANLVQLQDKAAGTYHVTWNGLDNNGNKVASGTYFYSMRFGNFTKTKQMTLMK